MTGQPNGSGAATQVSAPGGEANNQDLLVWALHRLGGAERFVDVEDVFLECFAIAPARLAWRTRPDLPDYKKCSKALQSVEATTHVGLLLRKGRYYRRLTEQGRDWVRSHEATLIQMYGARAETKSITSRDQQRRLAELRRHELFAVWQEEPGFTATKADLADLLDCTSSSGTNVWRDRVDGLRQVAAGADDESLRGFVDWVVASVEELVF